MFMLMRTKLFTTTRELDIFILKYAKAILCLICVELFFKVSYNFLEPFGIVEKILELFFCSKKNLRTFFCSRKKLRTFCIVKKNIIETHSSLIQ